MSHLNNKKRLNFIQLSFLMSLFMLASCQSQHSSIDNTSLYQQLGGEKSITRVINSMVTRLHHDPKLSELFVEVEDKELKRNFVAFICHLSGGGCEYQGAEMQDIHAELFITKAEFDRFVSLFIYSMEDENIPFLAQNKLLALLASLREEVIEI